jgi:hypothetical protein
MGTIALSLSILHIILSLQIDHQPQTRRCFQRGCAERREVLELWRATVVLEAVELALVMARTTARKAATSFPFESRSEVNIALPRDSLHVQC